MDWRCLRRSRAIQSHPLLVMESTILPDVFLFRHRPADLHSPLDIYAESKNLRSGLYDITTVYHNRHSPKQETIEEKQGEAEINVQHEKMR
jgi:hypothetical protein